MQVYGAGLLWCALALSWPVFQSLGSDLLGRRAIPRWLERLHLASWLGSVGVPYLALLSGAVSFRDYGLDLGGPSSWIPDAVVALLLALVLALVSIRFPAGEDGLTILEEPRWALYRALGWAWTGSLGVGIAVAVAGAILEQLLERIRRGGRFQVTFQDRGWLFRVTYSNLVFGLTTSFWLILLGRIGNDVLQRAKGFRLVAGAGQHLPRS